MDFTFLLWFVALIAIYAVVVRPILHALPLLKEFYTQADTFWCKLKACAWNSLTVAWSYFVAFVGLVLERFDMVSDAVGDPELKANLSTAIGADTKTLGYLLLGFSLVTLVARLRSIRKG